VERRALRFVESAPRRRVSSLRKIKDVFVWLRQIPHREPSLLETGPLEICSLLERKSKHNCFVDFRCSRLKTVILNSSGKQVDGVSTRRAIF
jgi:hypothetical protein